MTPNWNHSSSTSACQISAGGLFSHSDSNTLTQWTRQNFPWPTVLLASNLTSATDMNLWPTCKLFLMTWIWNCKKETDKSIWFDQQSNLPPVGQWAGHAFRACELYHVWFGTTGFTVCWWLIPHLWTSVPWNAQVLPSNSLLIITKYLSLIWNKSTVLSPHSHNSIDKPNGFALVLKEDSLLKKQVSLEEGLENRFSASPSPSSFPFCLL